VIYPQAPVNGIPMRTGGRKTWLCHISLASESFPGLETKDLYRATSEGNGETGLDIANFLMV
jgi:hypothetical protein